MAFGSGSDITRGADADKDRAGFGIDGERTILMALRNAEHALLRDHFRAVCPGNRFAFLRRHLIDALILAAAGAQRAKNVRHAPDAVLVGDQHVIALPGQPVRPVEIFDMPVDPHRVSAAVIAQQRQIAGTLFGDQNIAVRQHQETPRIGEAGCERRRREACRHLRRLPAVGNDQRPIGDDRPGLRRRQIGRIDADAPAQFMLVGKVLLQRIRARVIVGARRFRASRAALLIECGRRKPAEDKSGTRNPDEPGICHGDENPCTIASLRPSEQPDASLQERHYSSMSGGHTLTPASPDARQPFLDNRNRRGNHKRLAARAVDS